MTTADVTERYEALRAAELAHRSSMDRRGLVLLRREGMAVWAAAWRACSPSPAARAEVDPAGALAEPSAIVALLNHRSIIGDKR